jgi:hypothetical protein
VTVPEHEIAFGESIEPILGRSHSEVLVMTFDGEPTELIEDLVPRGVLMQVAGLPETYKGWISAKAAAIVAAGAGELFERPALLQGPVGYFWQDDSTRAEAERVQLFARVHETPADLPLRWYLNEGLILPDDLERLRVTIEHFGFVMVVLDSVYNFTPNLDLKDRDVGQLFARIKADVCDVTGCTVVAVDHMPWGTKDNRDRLRGYGDVFKGAAARAGIYVDAKGSKLWVEARGNNISGFKRRPAYWDADALELRLVDTQKQEEADEALDARVLKWLVEHPGQHSTSSVRKQVEGTDTRIDEALHRLRAAAEVRDLGAGGAPWSGRAGAARYWIASIYAPQASADETAPRSAELGAGGIEVETSATSAAPRRAPRSHAAEVTEGGSGVADVDEDEIERLADIARKLREDGE